MTSNRKRRRADTDKAVACYIYAEMMADEMPMPPLPLPSADYSYAKATSDDMHSRLDSLHSTLLDIERRLSLVEVRIKGK